MKTACGFNTAQNCSIYYAGPTTKLSNCNLENTEHLILQCQVSSNLTHDFYIMINWHYSQSPPNISSINSSTSWLRLQHEIKPKTLMLINNNNNVTSTLTITRFNATANGFYWCSVSSNDSTIYTPNPSTILRIWYQNECNNDHEYCEMINLHEQSTIQCADQDVNMHVIDAQTGLQTSTIGINTGSCTLGINSESYTMTVSNSNPASTFNNNVWIATGALTGCVILIFYCIVGVIIMYAMYHRRQGRYKPGDLTSPFDDIHMDTASVSMPQEKESDKNRVSNIFFVANASYECAHSHFTIK